MERAALEPDLGLGICEEGRGPFFIQRAQWEGAKPENVDLAKQTTAWPGLTGCEGQWEALAVHGPNSSMASDTRKGRPAILQIVRKDPSRRSGPVEA